jgi:arsenate reductase
MSVATIIYGIKNCTTVKKARAWLDARGVDYAFHDFKAAGIDRRTLEAWCKQLGWQVLLNRAGTTFRKLPDKDKQVADESVAIALMLQQPSIIKRPVLDRNGRLTVGFKPEIYETVLRGREK